MATPVHTLLLSDGQPGGTVVDLLSAATGAGGVGIGLKRDTFTITPPQEALLTDPVTFARHGQRPRAGRFDNRIVQGVVAVKGSSQTDAHTRLGQLEALANRARQWSYFGKGTQVRLKWKPVLQGRAYYANVHTVEVSPGGGYGGIALTNNIVDNVALRLTCEPDWEGYTRPAFYATSVFSSTGGNRGATSATGYYCQSNDYLTCSWLRNDSSWANSLTATNGAVLFWFYADWAAGEATTRVLLDLVTSSPASWLLRVSRAATTNVFTVSLNGGAKSLTITPSNWVQNAWYGVLVTYGATDTLRAYWITDGLTLGTSATATAFTGADWGVTTNLSAQPYTLYLGSSYGPGSYANCEFDSVQVVQQTGFEVQADTTSLPFTRDPGSIVVQYPRTLSNYLNPSAVSYTYGQMHTRVRHVPGNRPARTEARIRSVSNAGNGIYRLRLWASETRTDQTDCPIVFINRTQFGGAVQTGWANNSVDGNAYDGNNSVQSSAASNDYIAALQHTVTVGPNWSSAMMVPGTYLVWVRASFAAGTAAAGITIANGPTSLPYGPFTATLVAGAYIYVPMGQVTLPLTGVRPAGGGYTFTLTVNCQRPTSGTNYVDGTLWMLVDEENPPLSYLQIATNVIANTQQIETYSESRPDTFRVTQSGAVDAAWDCTQAGGVPRLFGGSDTRLWLSTDYNSSGAPANGRSDTTSLDLWLAPRYRTPG